MVALVYLLFRPHRLRSPGSQYVFALHRGPPARETLGFLAFFGPLPDLRVRRKLCDVDRYPTWVRGWCLGCPVGYFRLHGDLAFLASDGPAPCPGCGLATAANIHFNSQYFYYFFHR